MTRLGSLRPSALSVWGFTWKLRRNIVHDWEGDCWSGRGGVTLFLLIGERWRDSVFVDREEVAWLFLLIGERWRDSVSVDREEVAWLCFCWSGRGGVTLFLLIGERWRDSVFVDREEVAWLFLLIGKRWRRLCLTLSLPLIHQLTS